jgi:hypothetical protein
MRLERADAALLVAKDDQLFAKDFDLLRQIGKLVGGADRLPITAQQFPHRTARFDDGEVVGRRNLPAIG